MDRSCAIALSVIVVGLLTGSVAAEAFATYRSEDGGRSWQISGTGLPRSARVNSFGASGKVLLAATDHGVFISRDGAQSWHPSATNVVSARPLALADVDDRVFLGTQRSGAFMSRDVGQNWTPLPGLAVRSIRTLHAAEGNLLAGTDREGVFRSLDGTNWIDFSEGLPAASLVHQMANSGRTIFAALYHQGLYRRKIDGGPWQKVSEATPLVLTVTQDALVIGHNPGGLHSSKDGGERWTVAKALDEMSNADFTGLTAPFQSAPVWALASNSRQAFAGVADGIYSSRDQGVSWTRAVAGLPERSPGVAFLVKDRLVLATIVIRD